MCGKWGVMIRSWKPCTVKQVANEQKENGAFEFSV